MDTEPKPKEALAGAAGSAASVLLDRIRDYLLSGGSFNPELADHDEVRNLITDCQDWILAATESPNSEINDAQPNKS